MNKIIIFSSSDTTSFVSVEPNQFSFFVTSCCLNCYKGHETQTLTFIFYLLPSDLLVIKSCYPKIQHFAFSLHIFSFSLFLCQLTCQSADIMLSLCGVGVRVHVCVHVRVNNFFSKTTRPRDMLFFLKDTLSIEDEKLFKACKFVCSSVC